jgi:Domain of unknown function (DUF4157)/Protein of unknown function (DUF3238)
MTTRAPMPDGVVRRAAVAPPAVHDVLRSPGRPLDPAVRTLMEPRFGDTFQNVRVHADSFAADSARAVGARAYAVGRDVVFARGEYAPGTSSGRHLLAHELAHVVQQGEAAAHDDLPLGGAAAEREATAAAAAVSAGRPAGRLSPAPPQVAREPQHASPPAEPAPAPAPATTAPIRTVKLWLNAFIPATVPGKTIPAVGPHAGKTMLNGPIFSQCYLTDNRGFDAAIHAPSRIHAEIEIDVSGPSETFHWADCSETHEIHCKTGAGVCTKKGPTAGITFSKPRGSAASLIEVDMVGASNNPCYSGSPDIDYEGTARIDVPGRTVTFDGKIDDFPAFEMYATADGGAGSPLFTTMPVAGKDPWDLPGKAARVQTGSTRI